MKEVRHLTKELRNSEFAVFGRHVAGMLFKSSIKGKFGIEADIILNF